MIEGDLNDRRIKITDQHVLFKSLQTQIQSERDFSGDQSPFCSPSRHCYLI